MNFHSLSQDKTLIEECLQQQATMLKKEEEEDWNVGFSMENDILRTQEKRDL